MKKRYDYDPTEQPHVLVQAGNDGDMGFIYLACQRCGSS